MGCGLIDACCSEAEIPFLAGKPFRLNIDYCRLTIEQTPNPHWVLDVGYSMLVVAKRKSRLQRGCGSDLCFNVVPNWPVRPVRGKTHCSGPHVGVLGEKIIQSLFPTVGADTVHEIGQHHEGVVNSSGIGQIEILP